MDPSPATTNTPNQRGPVTTWQGARALLLHRLCGRLAKKVENGDGVVRAARTLARRWRGKQLPGFPERKLKLSKNTLLRVFQQWHRGGSIASAIQLNYAAHAKITPGQLRAFLKILFLPSTRSASHAYGLLCQRQRKGRALPCRSVFLRHLPAGVLPKLRAAQRAAKVGELNLAKLRLQIESDAMATIPPKRRVVKFPDFQI